MNDFDSKDKKQARLMGVLLVVLLVVLAVAAVLLATPILSNLGEVFNKGLQLKTSFVISFFVSLVMILLFTISSGDGVVGEIPFMLLGFIAFFFLFGFMIAWIF